jgi:hypothetical protein
VRIVSFLAERVLGNVPVYCNGTYALLGDHLNDLWLGYLCNRRVLCSNMYGNQTHVPLLDAQACAVLTCISMGLEFRSHTRHGDTTKIKKRYGNVFPLIFRKESLLRQFQSWSYEKIVPLGFL